MANLKASLKDIKQAKKRKDQNTSYKNKMKRAIRSFSDAVKGKEDIKKLNELASAAYSIIDKNAKVNVIHRNTAGRRKSKIAKALASVK